MANELQTKLDAILEDKNTNLLPEHLKAGVTCLGVEGEFEGGAQINNQDITINKSGTYTADEGYTGLGTVVANFSGGDTKTFETVEDMYADENPIPDGKALIYRKDLSYIQQNTAFKDIYLPEEIVLPNAVTEDITVSLETQCEHGGGGGDITISSTGFYINFHMNHSMAYFEYTSTDGITYTRTTNDVDNEMVDFDYFDFTDDVLSIQPGTQASDGYYMIYNVVSGDTEIAKEFFKRMSYGYYGLYINSGKPSNDLVSWNTNIRLNTNDSNVYTDWTVDYGKGDTDSIPDNLEKVVELLESKQGCYHNLIEKISNDTYRAYAYKSSSSSSYSTARFTVVKDVDTEDDNLYIGGSGSDVTISIFDVNTTNETVSDITNKYSFKIYPGADSTKSSTKIITTPINRFSQFTYMGRYQRNLSIGVMHVTSTGVSVHTNWEIDCDPGKSYSYSPAQTQFTLDNANQLLPDVCALGKNGEITGDGSIYSVISMNNYLEQKGVDLREGVIYLTLDGYNGVENTKATKSYLALRYMQCKKIENIIEDFYQVITTDKYNVWFNPINKILAVYDTTNDLLYEYTNEKLFSYDIFKYRLVGDVLYVYTYSGLLLKFGKTLDTVSVIAELYYYTDSVILTDTCAYAFVKSSSTVVNVNKILYDGTSSTLTSWTRAGGDLYGYNQLIIKDDILYGTYNTVNSNYGYLCMIDMTNDTVIKSTAYSLQGWIITNSEDKSLIFIQYANNNSNMYSIGTDGTLTSIGTLPYGIYNDTLDNVYYIPHANTICGFHTRKDVSVAIDSVGTSVGTFGIRQYIAGTSDTSIGGTVIPGDVSCEDNIIKCDFMYYNYTLKQNYSGTITIDMNYTFTTEKNTLFPIDTESLANNIYRKIQLFTPAIGTEYKNTISPTEYEEINTMAEDVLGGVE